MLVLTRKTSESLLIGDVRVIVIRCGGGCVKLGIEAPAGICIRREEVPFDWNAHRRRTGGSDAAEA